MVTTAAEWLPEITITGLRVGDERLSIRLTGEGTASRYEILKGRDRLTIKERG